MIEEGRYEEAGEFISELQGDFYTRTRWGCA